MKKVILFSFILFFLLIQISSGQVQTLKPVQLNNCVYLPQSYANSSWQNISYMQLPNDSIQNLNIVMTDNGGGYFTYYYCNTTNLGKYIVNGIGDVDGSSVTWAYDFSVTPSGNDDINSGQGLSLMGALAVIIIVSIFLFLISFAFKGTATKVIFIGLASIGFVSAILYSLVSITQVLGSYSALVNGLTTFWFVVRILVGIALTALFFFAIIYAYNIWMKYRGFRD